MELCEYSLGDIVAVKSHPYFSDFSNIIISGEYSYTPPLLNVAEVFRKRKDKAVGWDIADNVEFHYRCFWYSTKLGKFQDQWFLADYLKGIRSVSNDDEIEINPGDLVIINSSDLELGKNKSSLTIEEIGSLRSSKNASITAHLSSVCPILQVKELSDYKRSANEPIKDKAGVEIRFIPTKTAKCFWYNSISDKFSEVELPVSVLRPITVYEQQFSDELKDAVKNKKTIKAGGSNSLLQLSQVLFRSGKYYIKAYNLISNFYEEFEAKELQDFVIVDTPILKQVPVYDFTHGNGENAQKQLETTIKESGNRLSYLRFEYKNRHDKMSLRTISKYDIKNFELDGVEEVYLVGYCHLRREYRNFRVSRIQYLQELDTKFAGA
jgi:hypothetical protein